MELNGFNHGFLLWCDFWISPPSIGFCDKPNTGPLPNNPTDPTDFGALVQLRQERQSAPSPGQAGPKRQVARSVSRRVGVPSIGQRMLRMDEVQEQDRVVGSFGRALRWVSLKIPGKVAKSRNRTTK